MDEAAITEYIRNTFPGVETTDASGYTMFFYGADRKLPFTTIASSDNEHDGVSNLDRPGIFRLNIGVTKETFQSLFGPSPIEAADYDYTGVDKFLPHPDYAAWHFVCVLNPSERSTDQVKVFLAEGDGIAERRARRDTPQE